jgi:ankyrin repeat protein
MRILEKTKHTAVYVFVLIATITTNAHAQDAQTIVGIPVKIKREEMRFGGRWVELVLLRQDYFKENLERIWRYYCEKYPEKKEKIDVRVFVEHVKPDGTIATAPGATFNRQGEGAMAYGGDNEFYSYRPDPDKPNETVNVQLKGRYPFLQDSYSGEPGFDFVLAASKGNVSRIEQYFRTGGDVNARDDKGRTALIASCAAARVELVKMLLSKGADPNLKDNDGFTALAQAALARATADRTAGYSGGGTEIVRLLLDNGADVNAKGGWPPLFFAAETGNNDIVKLLLENGAEVNANNERGMSALSRAIYDRHDDTARLLLASGADVNSRDRLGETALQFAAPGSPDLVRELLTKGADVNTKNESLETPLMRAERFECVVALLDHGAELEAKDKRGMTALMHAVGTRNVDKIRALLRNGALVNARDAAGQTSLTIAKQYSDNHAIIDLLLRFGAAE